MFIQLVENRSGGATRKESHFVRQPPELFSIYTEAERLIQHVRNADVEVPCDRSGGLTNEIGEIDPLLMAFQVLRDYRKSMYHDPLTEEFWDMDRFGIDGPVFTALFSDLHIKRYTPGRGQTILDFMRLLVSRKDISPMTVAKMIVAVSRSNQTWRQPVEFQAQMINLLAMKLAMSIRFWPGLNRIDVPDQI